MYTGWLRAVFTLTLGVRASGQAAWAATVRARTTACSTLMAVRAGYGAGLRPVVSLKSKLPEAN